MIIQPRTLKVMYNIELKKSFDLIKLKLSNANAENVVNPPQKPTTNRG